MNLKKVKITKTKFSIKANERIFKIGFFSFGLNFVGIYLFNISRYSIDDLLSNDMQTIYGIILMPASFMALLGQYIVQPSITKISNYIRDKKYFDLKNIILKLLIIIIALGIAVFAVAYIFEAPVLKLVYGVDISEHFVSMLIIIVASVFYSISIIISAILISMRKTLSQVISYIVVSVIGTFIAYKFVENFQIFGASITYLLTMILISAIFIILTIKQLLKYKKTWEMMDNKNKGE